MPLFDMSSCQRLTHFFLSTWRQERSWLVYCIFRAENAKYKEHLREKNALEAFLHCQKYTDISVASSQNAINYFFLHCL